MYYHYLNWLTFLHKLYRVHGDPWTLWKVLEFETSFQGTSNSLKMRIYPWRLTYSLKFVSVYRSPQYKMQKICKGNIQTKVWRRLDILAHELPRNVSFSVFWASWVSRFWYLKLLENDCFNAWIVLEHSLKCFSNSCTSPIFRMVRFF